MTRKHWVALIASTIVLCSAVLLWWIATNDERQLDRHVHQALERYEQVFADDSGATPTPLPRDRGSPLLGVPPVEKVTVHHDQRTLTAEYTGGETAGPCGADYTARVVESEHAVLIVVEKHPHTRWRGRVCTMEGYRRQVTVRLSHALNGRAVLEAVSGMPVPVELTR